MISRSDIYVDDVLSLNNSKFGDFVDRIYPIELDINDIAMCASYLDIQLKIDSGYRLRTKYYDKRDDFMNSSRRKWYGRYHDLVNRYGIYVSQITTNMFHLS